MLTTAMLLALPVSADLKLPLRLSDNRVIDSEDAGLSNTLEHNFSPEDRARLRKALADYARNTDPDHQQMLQKRKAMHESISQRFNECNRDGNETLDRDETLICLPQVARHFSYVDLDGDSLITLEELETAYARMTERQREAESRFDASQSVTTENDSKSKSKPASAVIPASTFNPAVKDASVTRKRPG